MLIINTSALRRTVLPQPYERQPHNFKHCGPFPFFLVFLGSAGPVESTLTDTDRSRAPEVGETFICFA